MDKSNKAAGEKGIKKYWKKANTNSIDGIKTNIIEIDQSFEFLGVNDVTTSLPIAYQKSFFLKGGISDLFIQYSFKFNPKLSFGFQYSFLFGNQIVEERRYTYDIQIC